MMREKKKKKAKVQRETKEGRQQPHNN